MLRAARSKDLEPELRSLRNMLAGYEFRRNYRDDEHLKLFLRLWLAEDACCVDIGANVGAITEVMADAAPGGRHIAFEPLPELATELTGRYANVEVRCAAVAAVPGRRTFKRVLGVHTRSGFHEGGYAASATEDIEVEVQALDASLPGDFVPAFVKVDVEGTELEVLEGSGDLLATHRPVVALEHGGPPPASREIYRLLTGDPGLRPFDLDGRGPLDEPAFLDAVASGSRWNFLFRR